MRNFIQISDLIATSGQPERGEFQQIADDGYAAVINLAMHNSDNAIADEGNIVASLGMSYFHLPVPFDAPTAEHLKTFLGAMKTFENKKVWIHCALNLRVSAFIYHYRMIEHKVSSEEAKSPILKQWEPRMDAVWHEFMALDREDLL